MKAFINGTEVEVEVKELWWMKKGLSFTRSCYGKRIPTMYMVRVNNRWRRVYCCCFSNIGSLFIGNGISSGNLVEVFYG